MMDDIRDTRHAGFSARRENPHPAARDNAPDLGTKGPRRGEERPWCRPRGTAARRIVKEISNRRTRLPVAAVPCEYAGIVSVMRSLWHCIAIASLTLRAPNTE